MSDSKPFDLNAYAEDLRKMLQEKIRVDLAALMPEGVWLDHVKREVEKFVEVDRYGKSPLQTLVNSQLQARASEEIKRCLSSEGIMWGSIVTADLIKKVIGENMESLMVAVFGKALQDHIAQVTQSLPR
jgi:hypothetical protein